MIYSGSAISVSELADGIAELKLDLAGESVNKLNRATLDEFAKATEAIRADGGVQGVIVTSGKSVFIVGADITEFGGTFAQGEESIVKWLKVAHSIFSGFEDLPGDGFEWHEGYTRPYGLLHVDRERQTRRAKPSAAVFRDLIKAAGSREPGRADRR